MIYYMVIINIIKLKTYTINVSLPHSSALRKTLNVHFPHFLTSYLGRDGRLRIIFTSQNRRKRRESRVGGEGEFGRSKVGVCSE